MGRHAEDDMGHVRATLGADLDALLVHSLLRTQSHLGPFVDASLRPWNLSSSQFNALLVLRAAGPDGLLMGELGRRLVVTKSNVTGLADRLEREGLIARSEHRDRRATVLRLTDKGRALLDSSRTDHAARLAELTSALTDREKRTLIRLLRKLRRALRERGRKGA